MHDNASLILSENSIYCSISYWSTKKAYAPNAKPDTGDTFSKDHGKGKDIRLPIFPNASAKVNANNPSTVNSHDIFKNHFNPSKKY